MIARDSQPQLMRRSLIAATGLATAAGLAGCLGDDDGESGGDDGESGGVDGESGGDDEPEFEQPDFVESADAVFGRMEADWEEGIVTTEMRLEQELEDPDDADELVIYRDGDEVASGDVGNTVYLPLALWSDHLDVPLSGEVNIELINDFGDVLGEMEWYIDSSVEVVEVGKAAENADFVEEHFDRNVDEDDMEVYVHLSLDGDVVYFSEGHLIVEPYDLDDDRLSGEARSLTGPDEGEYAPFSDQGGMNPIELKKEYYIDTDGEMLIMLSDAGLYTQNDCQASEGEIVLERPVLDDVTIPIDVDEGEKDSTTVAGYGHRCHGADIHLAD